MKLQETQVRESEIEGLRFGFVITQDVDTLNAILAQTKEIVPERILILHSKAGSWVSANPSKEKQWGFVCQSCHEPVVYWLECEGGEKHVLHARILCGCTMLLIPASLLERWSEISADSADLFAALVEVAEEWIK